MREKGLLGFEGKGRGDLHLRIEVCVPEQPGHEERVLYEKLCSLRQNDGKKRRRQARSGR